MKTRMPSNFDISYNLKKTFFFTQIHSIMKKIQWWCLLLLLFIFFFCVTNVEGDANHHGYFGAQITPKEKRSVVSFTESGIITAFDVRDGRLGSYHLQFIEMEPGSLFLPVLLHSDMVFYVHTGKGRLSYFNGDEDAKNTELKGGDIYRLEQGSVFYVRSHADPLREKLRIHAIFDTTSTHDKLPEIFVGAYSNITDLVLGFDERVLEMGFKVSEEVTQAIKSAKRIPPIVPYAQRNATEEYKEEEEELLESILGTKHFFNKKKKDKSEKSKAFNVFEEDPDVKNCNGWSISVNNKDSKILRGCDLGFFMVNLTKGSMMGPHWNPMATEIAIVVYGEGMVQVVCPSNPSGGDIQSCENSRFRVKEEDVFVVPRYHAMAQMSFNNNSLVFVGFSTRTSYNHPQFLAGSRSVLQVINKEILAIAFNADNTTLDKLLSAQKKAVILECTSCAEEAERKMEEEIEREQHEEIRTREEEARKEEEEARKREEEESEGKRKKKKLGEGKKKSKEAKVK